MYVFTYTKSGPSSQAFSKIISVSHYPSPSFKIIATSTYGGPDSYSSSFSKLIFSVMTEGYGGVTFDSPTPLIIDLDATCHSIILEEAITPGFNSSYFYLIRGSDPEFLGCTSSNVTDAFLSDISAIVANDIVTPSSDIYYQFVCPTRDDYTFSV